MLIMTMYYTLWLNRADFKDRQGVSACDYACLLSFDNYDDKNLDQNLNYKANLPEQE